MKSGVDRPGQQAMGLSKSLDSDMPVIGDLGGKIDDKNRIADSPFAIEDPLVGRWFPLFK
jgi:hypothetical protein